MDLVSQKFSPAEIERLIGLVPATLRGYRHRDLLKGFGEEQPNGRWLYSGTEILTMALGLHLEKTGIDLRYAFWIGWQVVPSVLFEINHDPDYEGFHVPLWAFWTVHAGNPKIRTQGFALQWQPIKSLADFEEIGSTACTVVSSRELARHVPAAMVEYISGGNA